MGGSRNPEQVVEPMVGKKDLCMERERSMAMGDW